MDVGAADRSRPEGNGAALMNRRRFIAQASAVGVGHGLLTALPGGIEGNSPHSEVRGHMHRCLFLDQQHIDRMDGLEVRGHPAKRFPGNPLFLKKFAWEKSRLQLYGRSILYNAERKLYHMYYLAQPHGTHYPNVRVGGVMKVGHVTLPAYAESVDGFTGSGLCARRCRLRTSRRRISWI